MEPQDSRKESSLEKNFAAFAKKFGIGNDFSRKLSMLKYCVVKILNDDSGSMKSPAYGECSYQLIPNRFSELREMNKVIFDVIGIFAPIDVYFLNRPGRRNLRSFAQAEDMFAAPPSGMTPIVARLRQIIAESLGQLESGCRLLIFIATDGQPTNDSGRIDVNELNHYVDFLMTNYPNLHLTFMACVSDESLLEVMDSLGEMYPRVGVVDEFQVEKKEMQEKFQNDPDFEFTISDYLVKAALVSLDPEIKQIFRDR
ncbi:MAG: vWA domain-containing protein [Sulfobacillus sp.]